MNTIFFSLLTLFSLFVFMNLGKVRASKKQTDRNDRINRFGSKQESGNKKSARSTIIEGEAEEINDNPKK